MRVRGRDGGFGTAHATFSAGTAGIAGGTVPGHGVGGRRCDPDELKCYREEEEAVRENVGWRGLLMAREKKLFCWLYHCPPEKLTSFLCDGGGGGGPRSGCIT